MSLKQSAERVDLASLQDHIAEALEQTDDEPAKYHLREAYQKVVILTDEERS